MAAEVRSKHPQATVELIPSKGGVFEVVVEGRLVFSKKAEHRHANPGEVLRKIRMAKET